jgi:uncharacterized protein YbjT (DUF2867 family)
MTILITGATGQVGGAALRELGVPARVLVRDPAALAGPGVVAGPRGPEVLVGSFDDEPSLRGRTGRRLRAVCHRP